MLRPADGFMRATTVAQREWGLPPNADSELDAGARAVDGSEAAVRNQNK